MSEDTSRHSADADNTSVLSAGDRIVVLATMYVSYATFMVLRMAPPVAGASITGNPDLGIDKGDCVHR